MHATVRLKYLKLFRILQSSCQKAKLAPATCRNQYHRVCRKGTPDSEDKAGLLTVYCHSRVNTHQVCKYLHSKFTNHTVAIF
jgi:hypothetical protein